jgi:hypothetical protein
VLVDKTFEDSQWYLHEPVLFRSPDCHSCFPREQSKIKLPLELREVMIPVESFGVKHYRNGAVISWDGHLGEGVPQYNQSSSRRMAGLAGTHRDACLPCSNPSCYPFLYHPHTTRDARVIECSHLHLDSFQTFLRFAVMPEHKSATR